MKLCVIPARGGSKRIPRKNIKEFLGKPIISYSILTAINSKLFDKVIVSTDDAEIAELAMQYGAEVPFIRPQNISDDYATTIDVINHAISFYQSSNIQVELVCCLYATAPFITIDDLLQGYKFLQADTDYVFTATEFSFPIWRGFKINADGFTEMLWPENYSKRSQDLEKVYHDAGMMYYGRPEAFLKFKPIFGKSSKIIPLPHYRVQDIDTFDDWLRAEVMYRMIYEK
ncbi:MAG: pseudaminic acid cytidylyltransferase [Neisseriaceae bacterium]|nr:MAG: pseudaminic acid cytidylyltransferase [Neisseriaceae bacterium]